jgi:aspartate/tyrosine/aromatic aminotransferase
MKAYALTFYWMSDIQNVLAQLQTAGAKVIAVLHVPAFNADGFQMGREFIVVYQHTEEVAVMVKT